MALPMPIAAPVTTAICPFNAIPDPVVGQKRQGGDARRTFAGGNGEVGCLGKTPPILLRELRTVNVSC